LCPKIFAQKPKFADKPLKIPHCAKFTNKIKILPLIISSVENIQLCVGNLQCLLKNHNFLPCLLFNP